ncbi:TPA: hypothetical protein P0E36_004918 [Vibrio harveyi]|nr:hypothetical protein [Vibrio harveyi]
MSALSELIPLVRRKCPGVMDLMMLDALLDAYREFCLKSEYIHESKVISPVTANTQVSLSTQPDHSVLKITSATEKRGNWGKSELQVNKDYEVSNSGSQVTFTKDRPPVTVSYVVTPDATADPFTLTVSDDLIKRYGDKIAAGAASKLRYMPAQAWTEYGLAEKFERDFVEGCREAFRDRIESFNEPSNRTRKRNFY